MRQSAFKSTELMKATLELGSNFLTTFDFEDRRDGVSIKVMGCTELVPIFDMKEQCIRGVIYLFREPIPVIDLQMKLVLGATHINGSACIVLTEYERKSRKYSVGILVANISDVFDIASRNTEDFGIPEPEDYGEPGFEADDSHDLTKVLMNIGEIIGDIDFGSFEKPA